jgi:predicted glycosyltransferase
MTAAAARPSVLLVTSNGTGMGHLTRQSAVARALDGRADVVVLSLSSGLPVIAAQGVRSEYLPSYQRPWMPRQDWNVYLADRLVALAQEVRADVVVFDGVAPYRGLVLARRRLPSTAFVWFRRGLWRPGRNTAALRAEPFFDLVIEPGDFAAPADAGATSTRPALRIPPVSLLDVLEPLPRQDAAHELGLDPDRRTALVTLGSGALGDSDDAGEAATAVLAQAGWQIATTKGALATSASTADGVVLLTGVYPLAAYVMAFDLVVTAAGYNAVHEFVTAGIPTVLVPNDETATDDQVARARRLDADGVAVWADPVEGTAGVAAAVRRALEGSASLAAGAAALSESLNGGAQAAADALVELATTYQGDHPDLARRSSRARYLARSAAVSAALTTLGPSAADALRQRRRSRTSSGPTRAIPIDLEVGADLADRVAVLDLAPEGPTRLDAVPDGTSRPALMTTVLDAARVRHDDPIEHVLMGSSDEYLAARLRIVRAAYDVRSVTPAHVE